MKIGFFDSGMGGLSVMRQAFLKLPSAEFIYYADEENVPYGEKTIEQIREYTDKAVGFMVKNGAGSIVIACNTATSAAITYLRNKYGIKIVGMEPAVKKAIDYDNTRRVLVIATPVTVTGDKMKRLVDRVDENHLVDMLATPKLVKFAEESDFSSNAVKEYLAEVFKEIDFSKYSSIVLGCTHFNYFKEVIREIVPDNVVFVDGIEGTINRLISEIGAQEIVENDFNRVDNADKVTTGNIKGFSCLEKSKEYINKKIESKVEETPIYFSGRLVESEEDKERVRKYFRQLEKVWEIK